MKTKALIYFQVLLSLVLTLSCEKESPTDKYNYEYENDYIRDRVIFAIEKGTLGPNHLFKVNDRTLNESEINSIISSIKREDIFLFEIIDKTKAYEMFSTIAADGIVKINYYFDPLLKPEYYDLENDFLMDIIEEAIISGIVKRYPLIVLEGEPLLGEEIKKKLDCLPKNTIEQIYSHTYDIDRNLYGERATNGVIFIDLF